MNSTYLFLSIFVLLYILPLCICLYLSLKDMYKAYKHNKENPDKLPRVYTYGTLITDFILITFPGLNIGVALVLMQDYLFKLKLKLIKLFSFLDKRAF